MSTKLRKQVSSFVAIPIRKERFACQINELMQPITAFV